MAKIGAAQVNSLLKVALGHEQAGRYGEAEQPLRQILAAFPARSDANRALMNVLMCRSDWPALEAHARLLTQLDPKSSLGWLGMAHALLAQGKDAVASCEAAARAAKDSADAHELLGVALKRAGRPGEAIESFQRSLKIKPAAPGTLINLANTYKDLGQVQLAIRHYQQALALDPNLVQGLFNLGVALSGAGRTAEAKECYLKALAKAPHFAEAYNGLGLLHKEQSQLREAESSFRHALKLAPQLADASYNLGIVLHEQSRLAEAACAFDRAIALMPNNGMFRLAKATSTLPVVPSDAQAVQAGLNDFDIAVEEYAAWRKQQTNAGVAIGFDTVATLPFWLAYRQGNQLERLSRFADAVKGIDLQTTPSANPARERVRIGIVSNHFRRHSVWNVITKGLIQNLDKSKFELALYHLGTLEDDETASAKALADVWKDAQSFQGYTAWKQAIAQDQADVLFYPEVGMDPTTFLLASQRLAPLQIAGWGHPITSGLDTIDLYCSGDLLEPDEADQHYRERLVRLPGTGCYTTPIDDAAQAIPDILSVLDEGQGPVLLFPQMPFKLDPVHDELLARIVKGVGPCRIVIPKDPKVSDATDILVARLKNCMQSHGVSDLAHWVVIPWLQQGQFKTLLDRADVYLDCPSFSGYTTAWLGVHQGIPIVCWDGPFMRQRLAAGLLRQIGITDTIAATPDEYVNLAISLAMESPEAKRSRRDQIRHAAPRADQDLRVVRAFEQTIVDQLKAISRQ